MKLGVKQTQNVMSALVMLPIRFDNPDFGMAVGDCFEFLMINRGAIKPEVQSRVFL